MKGFVNQRRKWSSKQFSLENRGQHFQCASSYFYVVVALVVPASIASGKLCGYIVV